MFLVVVVVVVSVLILLHEIYRIQRPPSDGSLFVWLQNLFTCFEFWRVLGVARNGGLCLVN